MNKRLIPYAPFSLAEMRYLGAVDRLQAVPRNSPQRVRLEEAVRVCREALTPERAAELDAVLIGGREATMEERLAAIEARLAVLETRQSPQA
jgi:hypothetical protein